MGWSIHHPVGLIYYAPQQSYRGYTLLVTNSGDHATLVDMEGRICQRWRTDKGISHAYLLPNGHLLCGTAPPKDVEVVDGLGGSYASLIEMDWDGNVVWEYDNPMIHHDFVRLSNGNTLILVWEELSPEMTASIKGGYTTDEDPERMLGDFVQEITPDGSVVNEWKLWANLDVDEDIIGPIGNRREWTHCNSLNITPDGDLLVSFRRTDTVGIVDKESGKFKWKWGPGELSHQHNPTFLDNGHVLIFDNGSYSRGMQRSRVVEVDMETNEIVWSYEGSPPMSFYSFHISSADRLPNGNTLICEGAHGRIFEVTSGKQIVWEYINPYFYPDRRTGVNANATYRAYRYGPEHPALRGKELDPDRFANLNRLYNGR